MYNQSYPGLSGDKNQQKSGMRCLSFRRITGASYDKCVWESLSCLCREVGRKRLLVVSFIERKGTPSQFLMRKPIKVECDDRRINSNRDGYSFGRKINRWSQRISCKCTGSGIQEASRRMVGRKRFEATQLDGDSRNPE